MDTSETYIKMCEKAWEVQKGWLGTTGDFVKDIWSHNNYDIIYPGSDDDWKDCIWLPRQDQLQAMVDKSWWNALWDLWAWCDKGPGLFTSMEQLWLAFVYKEKYNKVWNGEDWVL